MDYEYINLYVGFLLFMRNEKKYVSDSIKRNMLLTYWKKCVSDFFGRNEHPIFVYLKEMSPDLFERHGP